MGDKTAIAWTDATWNPTAGCSLVSPGCTNCYAMREAHRLGTRLGMAKYAGLTRMTDRGPTWTGEVRLWPEALEQPLKWKRPRRIFVDSMSDLFHEDMVIKSIVKVFAVMESAHWHTFQILTKRARNMAALLSQDQFPALVRQMGYDWLGASRYNEQGPHWRNNVWLGVSVEDREHGLPRVEHLRRTPAAVRFLSLEPLLEDLGTLNLDGIHWVIVGGESGQGARSFNIAWARSVIQQCRTAGVAVFVKQLGKLAYRVPDGDDADWSGDGPLDRVELLIRDPKGADPSEWPEDLRVQEFPATSPSRDLFGGAA